MIWQHLEAAVQINPLRNETKTQLQAFYGFNIFRCGHTGCAHSTNPFATAPERDAHMRCHSRPFKCSDSCCEYSKLGYASANALSKHEEVHSTINSVERLNLVETSIRPVTITQIQTNWNILSDAVASDNVQLVKDVIGNCAYIDDSWPKTMGMTGEQIYSVYPSPADDCNVLVCGANVPVPKPHGNPLLLLAINSGSIGTLRWLLEKGFGSGTKLPQKGASQTESMKVRLKYDSNDTAITVLANALQLAVGAIGGSNVEAVQLLVQYGAQVTRPTIRAAARLENLELVKMLLSHGADCHITSWLLEAVAVSDDTTRFLLDCGADIDGRGPWPGGFGGDCVTALRCAAWARRPSTLKLLLDRGADPNRGENRLALDAACGPKDANNEEHILLCVNILLEAGANGNHDESRSLQAAAQWGFSSVVKLLLDKGADPNRHHSDSVPALRRALSGGTKSHALCAKLLLEYGANPSINGRGKPLKEYALTFKFPQYLGVTWDEVVEANKHKVPEYVEEKR